MKKLLLLFVLILPLAAFSQKKSIDGFLDIPFGSDSATVKKNLINRGASEIDSVTSKDVIAFSSFTVADRKAYYGVFNFLNNKFFEGFAVLIDFNESEILKYYDDLSADITAVYGKGEFKNNFGDTKITTRIRNLRSGNAFCRTTWESKNKNTISLKIQYSPHDQELYIFLEYQNYTLASENARKRESDL
jgi:hypothetical protein